MTRTRKPRPHERNPEHGMQYALPAPVSFPTMPNVTAQVLHDRNASVVNLQLYRVRPDLIGKIYAFEASGSAKREPGDTHDELTAELMAVARALEDLSRQVMSEARKRVRAAAEAQTEQQIRVAAKRIKAAAPPRHRTLEEWEALQKRGLSQGREGRGQHADVVVFDELTPPGRHAKPDPYGLWMQTETRPYISQHMWEALRKHYKR